MKLVHSNSEMMNVCSVLLLKHMGEKDIYEDYSPPCAKDYDDFVKKLGKKVEEYITGHSDYDYSRRNLDGSWTRIFDRDVLKKNAKVVQCVLIRSQENARKYLKQFGFMEIGPFKAADVKKNYNQDLYYYLISAETLSDFFYPPEEKKEAA